MTSFLQMERKTSKRKVFNVVLPTKRRKTGYKTLARVTQNPFAVVRSIPRGLNPLPFKMLTKLAYHSNYTTGAGAGAGTCTVRVFNAASLYDPDYSGTGHQPLGFDQIMPMYDHYVVLGAQIMVKACPGDSTYGNNIIGISGNAVVTPKTSAQDYQEAACCTWDIMSTYTSIPTRRLLQGYSPKIHMGITNPIDSDKLQGTETANPSDGWFWHVFIQPANLSNTHAPITLEVSIVYSVAFIEPKQLASS